MMGSGTTAVLHGPINVEVKNLFSVSAKVLISLVIEFGQLAVTHKAKPALPLSVSVLGEKRH